MYFSYLGMRIISLLFLRMWKFLIFRDAYIFSLIMRFPWHNWLNSSLCVINLKYWEFEGLFDKVSSGKVNEANRPFETLNYLSRKRRSIFAHEIKFLINQNSVLRFVMWSVRRCFNFSKTDKNEFLSSNFQTLSTWCIHSTLMNSIVSVLFPSNIVPLKFSPWRGRKFEGAYFKPLKLRRSEIKEKLILELCGGEN